MSDNAHTDSSTHVNGVDEVLDLLVDAQSTNQRQQRVLADVASIRVR